MKEACKTCHFVDAAREGNVVSKTEGWCLRFPPHVIAPNQSARPVVKLDWWCGEFSPKVANAAASTARRKPTR